MRVAAVILAAGASRRLGKPKQLAIVGGERLLDRAVRVALEAGCAPVIVVLGAEADWILAESDLARTQTVVNAEWREGMGGSIRVGIAALEVADGVVVMTCDQPAVTAQHLRRLIAGGETTASAYAGKRGVPAYFPAEVFGELRRMQGDAGARDLLSAVRAVELTGGELDVDTAESLTAAQAIYGT